MQEDKVFRSSEFHIVLKDNRIDLSADMSDSFILN